MSEFKRSPSKVWWASESVEWREISSSPGSQDSGFSDTETFPQNHPPTPPESHPTPVKVPTINPIPKDIFKEVSPTAKPANLTSNCREKTTPDKSIRLLEGARSEPSKKGRHYYIKNSPKVSRNLFNIRQKESTKDVIDEHQYSDGTRNDEQRLNRTAPAVLDANDSIVFDNSLSSDCESELECLFNGPLDSPKHTSTPLRMRPQQARVPPLHIDNNAVLKWMEDIRHNYEQECMTTLQCKSIASELNQKVTQKAAKITANLRNILSLSQCIESEYKNLNSEKKHIGPLAQSLAGNIIDFLNTHSGNLGPKITQLYDKIRKLQLNDDFKLIVDLFNIWQIEQQDIMIREINVLVDALENPRSEMELRATVLGVTSISLHNEAVVDSFIRTDIIPILLILCEKCEGSSLRSLLLRALSTMCCNTASIRQFEKYSGIQIITDTIVEDTRPEPERSEAVALLAQVTAPWIEDNHSIRGLQEYSKRLVNSLTKFVSTTRCCQNLLLCSAALANLSSMDHTSIKYMLKTNTIKILLDVVDGRGPRTSVYLLEQVAILLANVSAIETARKYLTEIGAPSALLRFLKLSTSPVGEDVEKRLQQKAIIALSRLCSEKDGALQVVEKGGVEKLVRMCREKKERYDSDAVLVATLATLRKICDSCGTGVLNAQDAQELVEPKLLDSFLAYSAQSESYV